MTKTYRQSFQRLSLLLLPFVLAACNSSQDNSLFTDAKQDVCPPGCTDSLVSDDSQINIQIENPTIAATSLNRVDIGGECYTSLYPTSRIIVAVKDTNGNAVDGTGNGGAAGYGIMGSSLNPICHNGKFDIAVPIGGLGRGSFRIFVTLVAYDSAGSHANSSSGVSYVTINR